jgi:acetyl esterase/lipase
MPMETMLRFALLISLIALSSPAALRGQAPEPLKSAIHIANSYRVVPNITYLKVDTVESKLDVYQSRAAATPSPTLLFIHGGNWVGGSKEASTLTLLPFLEMGWNVVNIDYRLVNVAPAPAAVEDCFCALRWIYQHAKDYNIDPQRIVASGNSAGGHLALLLATAPAAAGFDRRCPGAESLRVAAVVNWYGFPNLVDLMQGANARPAVSTWIGSGSDRMELAKRLSPSVYVRKENPPILTVHGDADPTSPYEHAVALHASLTQAGVTNELLTIPGGKHGGFTDIESAGIYARIASFLRKNNLERSMSR